MKYVVKFPATINPQPRALFCACFDPRFKRAIDDFIRHLGFKEGAFLLKSLGGGPLTLGYPEVAESRCRVMVRQIRFAFDHFPSLTEFIAIMHEQCAYYSQMPEECGRGKGGECRDLETIGGLMKSVLEHGKLVKLFLAKLVDDGRDVSFEQVDTPERDIKVPERFLRRRQKVTT